MHSPLRASKAWDDAQLQLRKAQTTARCANACVAAHSDFKAATKSHTLNSGNCMQQARDRALKGLRKPCHCKRNVPLVYTAISTSAFMAVANAPHVLQAVPAALQC
jgi:hypothetical protein